MNKIKNFFFLVGTVFPVAALSAQTSPDPPKLEFAFEVRAKVADPTVVGQLPTGTRRIIHTKHGDLNMIFGLKDHHQLDEY